MTAPNTPAVEYPLTKAPGWGFPFFVPNVLDPNKPDCFPWENTTERRGWLAAGLVYATPSGATACAKAMLDKPESVQQRYARLSGATTEHDPHGTPPNQPGAKLDAGKTRAGLVLGDFARALEQVARVGTFGAQKYTDHGWLSVPNGYERYTDALLRHFLSEHQGETNDPQTGLPHAAHMAWNALARLELLLRAAEEL